MPRSKRNVGIRELRVGLLVVIAIGVLIFLVLNASGDISFFKDRLQLKARFATADGLRPGAEVRLAGVRIGKVEDVRLLPPTDQPGEPRVEATISIDQEIDGKPATDLIRQDSRARLASPGLLGNEKIINITPGTTTQPPIKENDLLLPGDQRGTMEDLTASGTELTQQLRELSVEFTDIARKVNEGQGTLGRFVNDEQFYNNLNSTIRETNNLIRQIESGGGSAGRFINDPTLYNNVTAVSASLEAIAQDLRRGRGTAGRLLTDDALYEEARGSIARFNRSVDELNGMIADLRAGRGTAGKLLTDETIYNDARAAIARFNTTTERIDSVVAGLQRGEGTAGKLLTDDQLYSNVNQLSSETVKLLYDFRQNPRRYLTVRFSIF